MTPQWQALHDIVTARPDPVILELGAYDGTHTTKLARWSPGGRVYAFEAAPDRVAYIRERALPPNTELVDAAIGYVTGEVTMYLSSGRPGSGMAYNGSSSIRKPTGCVEWCDGLRFVETARVQSWRLDDWVASRGLERIDLIWADIQGAERDMIEHGANALAMTDWLCLETDPAESYEGSWGADDIAAGLGDGWQETARFSQDVLYRRLP